MRSCWLRPLESGHNVSIGDAVEGGHSVAGECPATVPLGVDDGDSGVGLAKSGDNLRGMVMPPIGPGKLAAAQLPGGSAAGRGGVALIQ
jgi:hypothetical protein